MISLFQNQVATPVDPLPTFQYKFTTNSIKTGVKPAIQSLPDQTKYALFDFISSPNTIQGINVNDHIAFVTNKIGVFGTIHGETTPAAVDGELVILFTAESDANQNRFALLVCPLKYDSTAALTQVDSLLNMRENLSMSFDMQALIPSGAPLTSGQTGNCFTYTCAGANGETTNVYYLKERLFVRTNLSGFVTTIVPSFRFPSGITSSGTNANRYSEGLLVTMGLTGEIFMECNPLTDEDGTNVDVPFSTTTDFFGKVSKDVSLSQTNNTVMIVFISSLIMVMMYMLGTKAIVYLSQRMNSGNEIPSVTNFDKFIAALPTMDWGMLSKVSFVATLTCLVWGIYVNSIIFLSIGLVSCWLAVGTMLMSSYGSK